MWDLLFKYPIEFSTTWISVIPLIVFAYRNKGITPPLRYVLFFLTVNLAFQWWLLYKCVQGENNLFYLNAYIVTRYCFVSVIFYKALKQRTHRLVVQILFAVFLVIAATDWINVGMDRSFKYAQLAECIFAGSLCLLFYKELLVFLPVLYLLKLRMFYVSSGLLLFYAGTLFPAVLAYYLNVHPYDATMAVFILIPYVLESVLYLIISIGIYTGDQ